MTSKDDSNQDQPVPQFIKKKNEMIPRAGLLNYTQNGKILQRTRENMSWFLVQPVLKKL